MLRSILFYLHNVLSNFWLFLAVEWKRLGNIDNKIDAIENFAIMNTKMEDKLAPPEKIIYLFNFIIFRAISKLNHFSLMALNRDKNIISVC